jgi:hypothetical protein
LAYGFNNSLIEVSSYVRCFFKDIFSAKSFNSLLYLNRWSGILSLHDANLIDWDLTWSNLHHHNSTTSRSFTNFAQSSAFVFKVKLMMDELP